MELKFLKAGQVENPTTGRMLEYIDKKPCVMAMIVDEDCKRTLMVKQYRAGSKRMTAEFPAGVIEEGQTALEAVFAEIRQEVGIKSEDIRMMVKVGEFYSSVGWTNEIATLYFVQLSAGFKQYEQQLDEEECIEYEWVSLDSIDSMFDGPIPIKTAMLLNYTKSIREE